MKPLLLPLQRQQNLNPREEAKVIKSIEEGVQSGGDGVSKRKFFQG